MPRWSWEGTGHEAPLAYSAQPEPAGNAYSTQRRRDRRHKRRAHATTASWWNGVGNPGRRLACSGAAGGTGHRLVWPVVLRSVATSRQTTKSDRLSHRARRRINELRVGFRREGAHIMASLDWSQCPAVESIPGKVSGAWVLRGTRMPVAAIFENIEAGANIDDIIEWFDGLDREQVKAVIEFAARSLDKAPAYVP